MVIQKKDIGDGECTFWLEGSWTPCCKQHDTDIYYVSWWQASLVLKRCVKQSGHPLMSWAMFIGVNIYYYSGLRWFIELFK